MLDIADLGRTPWEFSNSHGVLSSNFRLMPDGKVGGYSHYNEREWRIVGDTIELIREDGSISCVLSSNDDGDHFIYSGLVLDGSNDNYHSLRKKKLKSGLFIRTHFWDVATERALHSLKRAWPEEVFICADTTHERDFPIRKNLFPHTVEKLKGLGLIDRAEYGPVLWYNGDYPIYDTVLSSNFDYYIFVEYDCFVNCDLKKMSASFIESGSDFISPYFSEVAGPDTWVWKEVQKKADIIDFGSNELPVYRSFFPFIFISRKAALYLFARRLIAAHTRLGQTDASWPFCESFVPTELMRAGFDCKPLEFFSGPLPHMTLFSAQSWDEVEAGNISTPFVHPVLSGQRLIDKLGYEASERAQGEQEGALKWLRAAEDRKFSKNELTQLAKRISELQDAGAGGI